MILKQMFARADLVDMYSLADPERCKRYVVVAADALDKLFVKQRIFPKDKSKGTFYFQSIDGIAKNMPADIRSQQTRNCKMLAFFFIRIFQIFAALAISIIDSELPVADPVTERPRAAGVKPIARFISPPGVQGFKVPEQKRGWFSGGSVSARRAGQPQQGGEISATRYPQFIISPGTAYKILNRYLSVPYSGAGSSDNLKFEGMENLQVTQNSLYDGVPDARTAKPTPEPRLIYTFKDIDQTKVATGKLTVAATGDIDLTLSEVTVAGKASTRDYSTRLTPRYGGDIDPEDSNGKRLPEAVKRLFEEALNDILGDRFSVVTFFKDQRYIDTYDVRYAPVRGAGSFSLENPKGFLRGTKVPFIFKDKAKIDGETKDITLRAELGITKSTESGGDRKYVVKISFEKLVTTPEELKDFLDIGEFKTRTFTAISDTVEPRDDKNNTIPQYLQDKMEELLKKVKSDGLTRGGIQYTREGLPKPYDSSSIDPKFKVIDLWKGLAKDPPVKAHCIARAVQLLNVAAIKGTMGDAFSSACNMKFAYVRDKSLPTRDAPIQEAHGIKSLAFLFVDRLMADGTPKIADAPEFKEFLRKFKSYFERLPDVPAEDVSFDSIVDKTLDFCLGHEGERVFVDGSLASQLRQKAVALVNRQSNHVAATMRLIFELFDERAVRAGRIEMNEKVLAGGMDSLNELAEKARKLLVEYYGDCERTYTEGLYLMQEGRASLQYRDAPDVPETTAAAASGASGAAAGANE